MSLTDFPPRDNLLHLHACSLVMAHFLAEDGCNRLCWASLSVFRSEVWLVAVKKFPVRRSESPTILACSASFLNSAFPWAANIADRFSLNLQRTPGAVFPPPVNPGSLTLYDFAYLSPRLYDIAIFSASPGSSSLCTIHSGRPCSAYWKKIRPQPFFFPVFPDYTSLPFHWVPRRSTPNSLFHFASR